MILYKCDSQIVKKCHFFSCILIRFPIFLDIVVNVNFLLIIHLSDFQVEIVCMFICIDI